MATAPARLRKFALNLSRSDWPNEKGYAFYLQSRTLCNFVERAIASRKLPCAASKIVIEGVRGNTSKWYVNSCNVASVTLAVDDAGFEALRDGPGKHEHFIAMARAGLDVMTTLPAETRVGLEATFDAFRGGGYTNTWQHKKRTFREERIVVELDCSMTLEAFELVLSVTGKNGNTFRESLLRCDPDELAFHYQFKDAAIEDGYLVITSRTEKPLARVPLSKIRRRLEST